MIDLVKYPRTAHLEGSRLQAGDEDLASVPFATIRGRNLVVEEKIDGANAGLRFDPTGKLWLQSRGHFLTGGPREKHFHLFKQWASTHASTLWEYLGDRHALYGEWVYAKHTIYYDQLPQYFLAFDVFDFQQERFLTRAAGQALLAGSPVCFVPVLHQGPVAALEELLVLITQSRFKSPNWRDRLNEDARERGLDVNRVWKETDTSDLMEGLYIYVEEDDTVVERYKWVRASFLQAVFASGGHWLRRPILPNRLVAGSSSQETT